MQATLDDFTVLSSSPEAKEAFRKAIDETLDAILGSIEDDSAFSTLMLCCSIIAVLFAFCPSEGRVEIITQMSESEALDLETIVETAELRVESSSGLERVKDAIGLLRQVEAL